MSYFSENLKKTRIEAGLRRSVFADMIGVSVGMISQYETGKKKPFPETLKKISEALKKPVSYFLSEEENSEERQEIHHPGSNIVNIPIIGIVPAGDSMLAVEELEGYLPLPIGWTNGVDYALRVKGTSMIPDIKPGDHVTVTRQEYFEDGNTVIALVGNDEVVIKRAYHTKKGIELRNGAGETCYKQSEIKVIGRVIGVHRINV